MLGQAAVVELEEQLGGRLSACTGLKLDLPTVCHYSVPVKAGSKKEQTNRVQVKARGTSGPLGVVAAGVCGWYASLK